MSSVDRQSMFYVPVCSTCTIVASGRGIIFMLSMDMGIMSASASMFGLELLGTLLWTSVCYLLVWHLNNVSIFWKLFYQSCLKAVRQRLWFQYIKAPLHCGEGVHSDWLKHIQGIGLDINGWLHCLISHWIQVQCIFFFLLRGHLCNPSQSYLRSRVTVVSAKTCSGESCAAHCHLYRNGWRPLWAPTVTARHWWFHYLTACMIWWWHVSW
jgi:hypothetical protein